MNITEMKIQPVIKTETLKIAKAEAIGVLLMFVVFFVLHLIIPETVPFGAGVITSGIIGGGVAVLNFFLMGLSIQKMTETEDADLGKKLFKSYYRYRMLIQIIWGVIALAVPFFHGVAGLVPLIIPTFAIRMDGIRQALPLNKKNTETSDIQEPEPGKEPTDK
ncbi:MAG: ATP synthase subunit I [Lachnospiraceae bacterium]|nr:ATP synthase subunit I [Lachnospiraceae bacterium]